MLWQCRIGRCPVPPRGRRPHTRRTNFLLPSFSFLRSRPQLTDSSIRRMAVALLAFGLVVFTPQFARAQQVDSAAVRDSIARRGAIDLLCASELRCEHDETEREEQVD